MLARLARPVSFRSISLLNASATMASAVPNPSAAIDPGLKAVVLAAIRKGEENVKIGGGPFGAAVVKSDGSFEVVSCEGNAVTRSVDPTAHAEVCAIRAACKKLNTFDLSGHIMVTSCYPCAMCFGACYWAHVDKVIYAATPKDAADAGFDDVFIYEEIRLGETERRIPFAPVPELSEEERIAPFTAWKNEVAKTPY